MTNNLDLLAYCAILLWMLFWSLRVYKNWTGDLHSIKNLLFLGFTWIGIISAGMNYFVRQ